MVSWWATWCSAWVEHLEESEKFWEVTDLTKMDVSHNEIAALDERFAQLGALNVLIARNNRIATVHPAFGELGNLQSLDLTG